MAIDSWKVQMVLMMMEWRRWGVLRGSKQSTTIIGLMEGWTVVWVNSPVCACISISIMETIVIGTQPLLMTAQLGSEH